MYKELEEGRNMGAQKKRSRSGGPSIPKSQEWAQWFILPPIVFVHPCGQELKNILMGGHWQRTLQYNIGCLMCVFKLICLALVKY